VVPARALSGATHFPLARRARRARMAAMLGPDEIARLARWEIARPARRI
jgi:hypothetical protein